MILASGDRLPRAEPPDSSALTSAKKLPDNLLRSVQSGTRQADGKFSPAENARAADESHADLARGQSVYQERCVSMSRCQWRWQWSIRELHVPAHRGIIVRAFSSLRRLRMAIVRIATTCYARCDKEFAVRRCRAFSLLPDHDLQAVVDYVITLTRRGELESQIV